MTDPGKEADISVELQAPDEEAGEPIRRSRPNELTHAVGQAGDGPRSEPEVFIDTRAVERMLEHARDHRNVETGGLLVGEVCEDAEGRYVQIVAAVPARLAQRASTSLTFTHGAWDAMLEERERRYPHHEVVGWYHTHPNMRVFLSARDQFIHQSFFARPQDVAVVIDPVRLEWGVFRWNARRLELSGRFFVYGKEPDDGAGLAKILQEFAPYAVTR